MRCAERPGMGRMLWLHELYMVMESHYGAYLYQAIEFKVGSSLPPEELIGATSKAKKDVERIAFSIVRMAYTIRMG